MQAGRFVLLLNDQALTLRATLDFHERKNGMAVMLFLNANVYLSFYLFGKDDLVEMEKVVKLIEHEEINLITNSHLEKEISRNREAKIAEGFFRLKKSKFGIEPPKYCSDYGDMAELSETLKSANRLLAAMVEKIEEDILQKSLRADRLINNLLEKGHRIEVSNETIRNAETRTVLRDPPGKKGSIGDAIHWLTLLEDAGNGDIHFVTLDDDFASKLDTSKISSYLATEWQEVKSFGRAHLHRSLSAFFKEKFPDINLSVEQEKDALVDRLKNSGSFAETHATIAALSGYNKYTLKQKKGLFWALLHNHQVGWIATDEDVLEFYKAFEDEAWDLDMNTLSEAEKVLEVKQHFFSPF